jgi:hypothetical protein
MEGYGRCLIEIIADLRVNIIIKQVTPALKVKARLGSYPIGRF